MRDTSTSTDGTAIAWSHVGSGDPVVLVHGITQSAATFAAVVDIDQSLQLDSSPGFANSG